MVTEKKTIHIKNKKPYDLIVRFIFKFCREDGIRTHDTVTHIQTFQACSFNHSDTSLY